MTSNKQANFDCFYRLADDMLLEDNKACLDSKLKNIEEFKSPGNEFIEEQAGEGLRQIA